MGLSPTRMQQRILSQTNGRASEPMALAGQDQVDGLSLNATRNNRDLHAVHEIGTNTDEEG